MLSGKQASYRIPKQRTLALQGFSAEVGPAMKRGRASGSPSLIDARIDGSFKG